MIQLKNHEAFEAGIPNQSINQIKKSFIASCLHNFWAKVHNLPKEIEHLKYYTVL